MPRAAAYRGAVTSHAANRVRASGAAVAAAAALAIGAGAAYAQAGPDISAVHVKAAAPAQRAVVISSVGRPFQHVAVCDLQATACVSAHRVGRHRWRAILPAQDLSAPYRIGVVARSGDDYVIKSFGDGEAAEPFTP